MAEPLICERCGGDNPADARFCIDCGATLISATTGPTTRLAGIACPSCGTSNPEQARFCVLCGRSFSAPQPAPARGAPPPTPARRAAPRTAPRPAAHSYPRTATPPTLTPFRPAQAVRPRHQNPAPFIFLIGLVVLLANHTLWPGILVLAGVSMLISQVARGRPDKGMNVLFWLGGITLLLSTGTFWPGIIVLFLLNTAINGRWHHHW